MQGLNSLSSVGECAKSLLAHSPIACNVIPRPRRVRIVFLRAFGEKFSGNSWKRSCHSASSPYARNFTVRRLLRRQISLRAFSYSAEFHSAHYPTALNLIPLILLQRLLSLFECFIIYVKFDLSMVPTFPQPSPSPPYHCRSPFQLVAWGHGSPSPWP